MGHFDYLVLPFGLTNATAVLQALVNDMLGDMLNHLSSCIWMTFLFFPLSPGTHPAHSRGPQTPAQESTVKAEKCKLHADTILFLGHIISPRGVEPDPAKVKAVAEWPIPDSHKALQRFLGFCNFYRRFIRGFGQIATPLTALTSTKVPFKWCAPAQVAFDKLKSRVLCFPDPERQFTVEVDASDIGIGAVLSQRRDEKVHPCAFYSHRLSPVEQNYDIGNRELLAVRLALGEWRHWLEGAAHPFLVWMAHKNMEYVRSAK